MEKNQIIIYTSRKGEVYIEARVEDETIWLTQKQIADLFDTDRTVIGRHIRNIFSSCELDEKSNVQKMHIANSDRPVSFYNLDTVISVGYRVNSKKATAFRIWATKILRSYLKKGYAVNEKLLREQNERLEEIKSTILMIGEKAGAEELTGKERELLRIVTEYAKTWKVLDEYDEERLKIGRLNRRIRYEFNYQRSKGLIDEMKRGLSELGPVGDLFGVEISSKLKGVLGAVDQTFDGIDLYPSVEEKAANLLYLTIKDHPFVDGNKRIASMLFLYYLKKNRFLYREDGRVKINDNSIITLALLVAASNPKEKDNITKLIINLLQN